jgi:hypothetical protein
LSRLFLRARRDRFILQAKGTLTEGAMREPRPEGRVKPGALVNKGRPVYAGRALPGRADEILQFLKT